MARQCSVCGKCAQTGNQVTTRGKKKYLGGVGTKVTGISRRQFKPNLQSVKIMTPTGGHKHALVCVQCIRSGGVTKVVRAAPFKVPHDPTKAPAKAAKAPAKTAKAAKK
jgi:large subunit ribosomal protein L28